MQDLNLRFTDGPQRGQAFNVEIGRLVVGRQPGNGGLELKSAGSSVSRQHAEIVESDGDIVLQNLSPNGTHVDGSLVLDRIVLKPGSRIQIGPHHTFEVGWSTFEERLGATRVKPEAKAPATKKGPLSSPIIRAVIGIYLVGIVALAVWFGLSGDSGAVTDDWPALLARYQAADPSILDDESRAAMLARAEVLMRELRASKIRGLDDESERICRELMSLDTDRQSPLYQYGARCLGSL